MRHVGNYFGLCLSESSSAERRRLGVTPPCVGLTPVLVSRDGFNMIENAEIVKKLPAA
jgi:hypothetical protein